MSDKQHIMQRWLNKTQQDVNCHKLLIFTESNAEDEVMTGLSSLVRNHYIAPSTWAQHMEHLGATETAKALITRIPSTKQAMSGDIGEIFATEIVNLYFEYNIPIFRLRYKINPNVALSGDDIVAVSHDSGGKLCFLKGEVKSRIRLNSNVISEAIQTLNNNSGRPDRASVLFVAMRLRELDETDLAMELETAVVHSFDGYDVQHLLFTLTGTNPVKLLTNCLKSRNLKQPVLNAIGLFVNEHQALIQSVLEGVQK